MKGLKESFRLIYSNTHLRTRETLPLIRFQRFSTRYIIVCHAMQPCRVGCWLAGKPVFSAHLDPFLIGRAWAGSPARRQRGRELPLNGHDLPNIVFKRQSGHFFKFKLKLGRNWFYNRLILFKSLSIQKLNCLIRFQKIENMCIIEISNCKWLLFDTKMTEKCRYQYNTEAKNGKKKLIIFTMNFLNPKSYTKNCSYI